MNFKSKNIFTDVFGPFLTIIGFITTFLMYVFENIAVSQPLASAVKNWSATPMLAGKSVTSILIIVVVAISLSYLFISFFINKLILSFMKTVKIDASILLMYLLAALSSSWIIGYLLLLFGIGKILGNWCLVVTWMIVPAFMYQFTRKFFKSKKELFIYTMLIFLFTLINISFIVFLYEYFIG